MIDTHCHLDDVKLADRTDEIVAAFKENNITKVINIGVDSESSVQSVELASRYTAVYASVGFHPSYAEGYSQRARAKLFELAKSPKCVAIGEIGLDYHYDVPKELQKEVFVDQIKLADECGLPIIVHIRDAYKDSIDILDGYKHLIKKGGVIHCYNGSAESAAMLIKMGFHIAFGGAITFTNNVSSAPVITSLPFDKLLIETDCPYLCPVPHRGKINEPKNAGFVLQKMAEIKSISVSELDKITTDNAYTVFEKLRD